MILRIVLSLITIPVILIAFQFLPDIPEEALDTLTYIFNIAKIANKYIPLDTAFVLLTYVSAIEVALLFSRIINMLRTSLTGASPVLHFGGIRERGGFKSDD